MMADASSTALLTPSLCASLGDEFVHQRSAGFHVLANETLSALYAPLHGRDAQFVVGHAQHDHIACANAEGFAKRGRDNKSAVLIDFQAEFFGNGTFRGR